MLVMQPLQTDVSCDNTKPLDIQSCSLPVIEDENAIQVIQVNRIVSIKIHAVVEVIDQYQVKNLLPISKQYIQIAVPYSDESNIFFIEASSNNVPLTMKKQVYSGDGYLKWNVYADSPLLPDQIYDFKVVIIYGNAIDFSLTNQYVLSLGKHPVSPYTISSYSTSISQSLNAQSSSESSYSGTNISPLTSESFTYIFSLTQDSGGIVRCISLEREVRFDEWGLIYIKEKHTIKNLGDVALSQWSFNIPGDYVPNSVKVYDSTSLLITNDLTINPLEDFLTSMPWWPKSSAFIQPLNSLFLKLFVKSQDFSTQAETPTYQQISVLWSENRRALSKNQETTYWIEYRLPYEQYVQVIGDEHFFKGDIISLDQYPFLIDSATIEYLLPYGASIQTVSPSVPEVTTQNGRVSLKFSYENLSDMDDIDISCQFNALGTYILNWWRPAFIMAIISAVIFAYVVLRRELPSEKLLIRRPKVVVPKVIQEFVDLYSEKIAHDYELERLETNLRKGKIRKREYRMEFKNIDRKILDLETELKDLKSDMRTAGGIYKEIVDKLEVREAERDQHRESLKLLEIRYRQRKRLTPAAYRKLKNDLEKKVTKSKNSIDKLLSQLRDLGK